MIRYDLPAEQVKGSVYRLTRPAILEEDLAGRLSHWCIECHHPMATHDWPKSKLLGCVVAGSECGKFLTLEAA